MKNEKIKYSARDILKGSVGLTKVALGIDKADPELSEKRIEICNRCDRLIKSDDPKKHRCGVCKCWVSKKSKLSKEKCPLNKW
jgi:hypothetical protein